MKKFLILVASAAILFTGCDIYPTEGEEPAKVSDITVVKSDLIFSHQGGSGTITVEATGNVTATSSEGWCQVNAIDNRTVNVTVDMSSSFNSRYSVITLSCGGSSTDVTVHQFGIRLFGFEPKKFVEFAKYGGTVSFPYDADCPLTVNCSEDWVVTTWNEDGLTISVGEFSGTREAVVNWTVQGATSGTIKVHQDGNWKSLGNCIYTDGFFSAVYDIDDITYPVEIQESVEKIGYYRILCPYGEAFPYNEPGDYDDTKPYFMYIDSADRKNVTISEFNSGCDWGYDSFIMKSILPGKYENNVITFPVNGLSITLPGYNNTSFDANVNGSFKVDLTGLY